MAIRRACSYQATFQTPEDPANYSAIIITIQQNGANIINKSLGDNGVSIDNDVVVLNLNQEETAQFIAGTPALIQIRCFASEYNAPGSACFGVDVGEALNDTILTQGD